MSYLEIIDNIKNILEDDNAEQLKQLLSEQKAFQKDLALNLWDALAEVLDQDQYDCAKILIDYGVDWGFAYNDALLRVNIKGLVFLLENNLDVNPNAINNHGQTPLLIASELGDVDAVQRLLILGADPRINGWLYHNLEYVNDSIQEVFRNYIEGNNNKTIQVSSVRFLREIIHLLQKIEKDNMTTGYVEYFTLPTGRFYEEESDMFHLVEYNLDLIKQAYDYVINTEDYDVNKHPIDEVVLDWASQTLGGGELTLGDLFTARLCDDCIGDVGKAGWFWKIHSSLGIRGYDHNCEEYRLRFSN